MNENNLEIISVILFGIIFVLLPIVNHFYQKRANDFADNLLKDIPKEYNKQIKGNAYRYLIILGIWAILSGWLGLYNISNSSGAVLIYKIIYLLLSLGFFVFGIWSYKKELKKLLVEKQIL